jgi:hypothetical protein
MRIHASKITRTTILSCASGVLNSMHVFTGGFVQVISHLKTGTVWPRLKETLLFLVQQVSEICSMFLQAAMHKSFHTLRQVHFGPDYTQ